MRSLNQIASSQLAPSLPRAAKWGWRRLLVLIFMTVMCGWGMPTAIATAQTLDSSEPPTQSIQPYIDRVASEITEFTLDNGMKFIVLERHQAPVISFITYADVGAANEEDGKTGIAHYLEHLAFKGTTRIGTTNYAAEKPLMERMDTVFRALKAAEDAGQTERAADLAEELKRLQTEAAQYVEQNKLGQIVEQAGGAGLNATTSADATRYFYSFPSNKLELWMSLESERFLEPVFREFYEEKDVILEERRMRVDNSPIGTMIEKFLETAFESHPYRRPVIGYEEDLFNATRQDIQTFFDTYYGPSNLTIGIVGDVDPAEVKQLAEAYFGRFQEKANPPELVISESPQTEPQEFALELPSQPWYLEGYHRPAITDPDNAVYGLIDALLTSGRTSRLYKTLVEDQQVALDIGSANGFPGDKYSNILLLYALTAPGHTVDEAATAIGTELTRLRTEPVSAEELDRVKTQARAGLLRTLSSNQGMASLLVEYEAKTGSWRNVFQELEAIEAVTAEDILRVAQTTFQPQNRTVGRLLSQAES
jgi:predicted Zn-dependent peptidase